MKKSTKALLLTLCAVALVIGSLVGTLAYLTDSEAVTNTFTVGQVHIKLDEAKVDANGKATTGDRVTANEYHLLPGQTYDKDPIVHIDADSESCYVFVKVVNGIADIEAADNKISAQIATNGWTALDGVANVYYKTYTKGDADRDYEVFQTFKIDGDSVVNVDEANGETVPAGKYDLSDYDDEEITVTAYAIQAAGFENAAAAWTAGNFK